MLKNVIKFRDSIFLELTELYGDQIHSKAYSEFVAEWPTLLELCI